MKLEDQRQKKAFKRRQKKKIPNERGQSKDYYQAKKCEEHISFSVKRIETKYIISKLTNGTIKNNPKESKKRTQSRQNKYKAQKVKNQYSWI